MKVQASKVGFYAGRRIREGEVFTLPEGAKPGKWMVPVSKTQVAKPQQDPGPRTLSEMTQRDERRDAKASGRA